MMGIESNERLSPMWVGSQCMSAPPGLEFAYDGIFSNLDLQDSNLLDGGLGTTAHLNPRSVWQMQDGLMDGLSRPDPAIPDFKFVKKTPILSLSERLDGHAINPKGENRKATPPKDLVLPPGMGMCENEKGRVRDQRFAPKKRDLLSQYSHHTGPVVTLMICNIPCRITQHQLVEVINVMGFNAKYDFLYLPTGGRSSTVGSSNLGYGFINFTDPSDADPFTQCFTNYQFEGTSSTKVCTVRPAHIQGLENNILHFDRTAAKGRPRREGPFIRLPKKGRCLEAAIKSFAEELSSCGMQDCSWMEASYFDFLEDTPEYIGCA